ncbi:MAG TPA: ABC transporter ATP-binding protein [Bryobacteraceae bacterium]|jgi:ABC-2 type transport system ATP-binding protein|nr:ABC transporter ATP-binding protein [Bryobacteraceae bacterium]
MSNPIRIAGLTRKFRRTQVLQGIDLAVPRDAVFALIGPNGAGKTTTIKILMNILRPTSGCAEILGMDSRRLAGRDFTRIGYVSENQELPDWMTVDYFMRYLRPFYPAWDDELAGDLLRRFNLPGDRQLKHLSRGMRMKAALASSLPYRPEVIVLDEPFTGLDPLARDEFIEGLLERSQNTTILISSHDLADIETFASHIAYLEHGRIQFAEELSALSDRFREIEITFDAAPPLPAGWPASLPASWPASWLQPESSAALIRFTDSHYDAERTIAEIRARFPGIRDISATPMPLRAIFVTVAKSTRGVAA